MRTDDFLISPCFPEVSAEMTVLKTNDLPSNFSYILNLLLLLPYPTNTITNLPFPCKPVS